MRIGGLQKFSLIDYPGKMAAVIFTQGCNFRCPYCHNSELVLPALFKNPIPESVVLEFLQRRRGQLEGVVVTGGEPTIQEDLIPFLKRIRLLGYAIKLDTNGSRPGVLEEIISRNLVDFIAMDVKTSFKRYEQAVGRSINVGNIKKSIRLIINSGVEHQFRTTLVKSFCAHADLVSVCNELQGAQEYRLQKFVPTERVISKDLLKEESYSDEEFNLFKQSFELRRY